ncbi:MULTISPECIES: type II toxin-antitoxin system RelE/ParE family toxin [Komagataeibacter]|uniref:RelE/ParE family toxin n=1 Tax=Komagataeibacter oboediens TaxID=65958 RepID=A0A318QW55_9PROT|nr:MULTISPECIES: type II toxin-antitoxin system RelE/ParE family toxin [Komagataeibacter]PYD81582.1 RelE/ParE family toxin [Komagataeibacter oboediens]GBR33746.1 plasmid stabilization system protein [Komagataeibacter oboediens DSM 11826]
MKSYILTEAAEADLRAVIRYTTKQWGDAQVRRYVAVLEQGIISLVEGHSAFKDMSTLCPGLRMVRVDHHYIFCLPREGAPALVVAILHERMDLLTRLAGRL